MKKLFLIHTALFLLLLTSCATNRMTIDARSVILETTSAKVDFSKIKITEKFGETQNPFTGKTFFRDYVAYPYYSIKKFCSALDGEISEIKTISSGGHGNSIAVRTEDLEIEYFGWIKLNEELHVGDKISKGTFLGTLYGGGDCGMKLKIRMKYKNKVINPEKWLR
ncbi:hypothetical protein [Treponema zioleckii]|uniref:hypothetical protein n=1 Tax=Treponema zioleckii TaxID=331680 RepID=UPI00168AD37E|nr:hypothetical protein [Treponema zioleckii]